MSKPRVIAAVTLGHFVIDIFNSQGPVLLAWLRTPMALSAAQIGLAVGLYQFLAGATQPLFGWVVDRIGSRFLGPGSLVFTVACLVLAVEVGYRTGDFQLFLVPFALAAIGSGAFHPQGTLHAGTPANGQPATTTAIFFFFGQIGLASGPPLAGLALDRFGPSGIAGLALVLSPTLFLVVAGMTPARHNPPPARGPQLEAGAVSDRKVGVQERLAASNARTIALLAFVFAGRAWVFIGTAAFLPLLFELRGWSSSAQGGVTGLFWLGGGLTGIAAGWFADRMGRRLVVSTTTLLGAVLLFFLPTIESQLVLVVALACGALLGAPHSVLMVMAQALLPVKKGLASGIALGYLFAMGAVASFAIGALADRFGLVEVLQAGALIGLAVAITTWMLPRSATARAS